MCRILVLKLLVRFRFFIFSWFIKIKWISSKIRWETVDLSHASLYSFRGMKNKSKWNLPTKKKKRAKKITFDWEEFIADWMKFSKNRRYSCIHWVLGKLVPFIINLTREKKIIFQFCLFCYNKKQTENELKLMNDDEWMISNMKLGEFWPILYLKKITKQNKTI